MSSIGPGKFWRLISWWGRTSPGRYGFTICIIAAVTGSRYLLGHYTRFAPPFLLFYPAILLIGLFAGLQSGVFATFLSAAVADWLFMPASSGRLGQRAPDAVAVALFCLVGIAISAAANVARQRGGRLEEFERAVEGLEEMIAVVDHDHRYVIANRAFLERRGLTRKQVIGARVEEVVDPQVYAATVKERMEDAFRGEAVRYEMEYTYPALGKRNLVIWYFPIEGPRGVDRIASVLQDVTERKQAEQELESSERRYRMLFEKNLAGVATCDLKGLILDCNAAWAKMLGYDGPEEIRGRSTREFYFNVSDREPLLQELNREGAFRSREIALRRKDGSAVWVLFNCSVLLSKGETTMVQATAIDITDRRQAEQALRESEQRERLRAEELQTVLDTLPIPVLMAHDAQCAKVTTNRAGWEHFGVPPGSNISLANPQPFHFRRGKVELSGEQLPLPLAIASGLPVHNVPITLVLADGTEKHELGNAAPLLDPDGKVRGAVAAAVNVTEQVKAESALRKSEEHFRILVEQAPSGIFIADSTGKYLDVNSAGAEMLGYTREEILELSIADVVAPEEIERIPAELQALDDKGIIRREWKFKRKDGSFVPGEVFGRKLPDGRLQGIVRDITDRKRAEEILRQSEERFRVALKDSPITVFNQDRDLRYTWVYNPQFCWQGDILGKTDDDLLGADKAQPLRELKQRVIEAGAGVQKEIVVRQNGKGVCFYLAIEPLFDSESHVVGITGSATDIARLRELADSLQDAKEQLIREKSYLEKEIDAELGFEGIIGQSPALGEVLKKARVVAPTDSTVLLLGETGTGKELVARSIHALSARHDRSFIKLNCAAVPTGLLESELFGHEKGAFTGAVSQKVGRLELADKGTLLLDEVGELPLELQPKLLRVLQDREFERLGGVRTLRVDVRIISATNRDLQADVAAKKFREDLFYRLNVFPIELPPLRQRRGDIVRLVHHFVAKYATRMGKHIEEVPRETMTVLEQWNWPGNVRELENMIERMVILSKGNVLAPPPVELNSPQPLADDSLTEMEREHIIRVLRETNGVLAGPEGAASRLGVKRTTLQSMLKRFNIDLQGFRGGTGTLGPGL